MKWIDFARPHTVEEAVGLLTERGDRARPLAGGTDLIVQLRTGVHDPDHVVDIKLIPELNELSVCSDSGLTMGAAVPCYRIYGNADVAAQYPRRRSLAERRYRVAPRSAGTCATPCRARTPYRR